jgi:FkbM family methyltransferase
MEMGKTKRDMYLRENRISEIDFLPERPYILDKGVKAIPRRKTHDYYMLFTSREEEVKQHLVLKENEIFVDVGANVGTYALIVANKYKDRKAKVIAIEPHPENYRALCKNIQINNLENIIKPVNKAVSDHKGKVLMYERSFDGSHRVDSEMYSIYDKKYLGKYSIPHPNGKSLQVECDTLDNILVNQSVDIMKIDIEGAEVLALKGATNTLKQLRKVVVEIHGDNFDSVNHILGTYGFNCDSFYSAHMQYIVASK